MRTTSVVTQALGSFWSLTCPGPIASSACPALSALVCLGNTASLGIPIRHAYWNRASKQHIGVIVCRHLCSVRSASRMPPRPTGNVGVLSNPHHHRRGVLTGGGFQWSREKALDPWEQTAAFGPRNLNGGMSDLRMPTSHPILRRAGVGSRATRDFMGMASSLSHYCA